MYASQCIYLCVCAHVWFIYVSLNVSIYASIYLSIYRSFYLSIYLSIDRFMHLYFLHVYKHVYMFVHTSIIACMRNALRTRPILLFLLLLLHLPPLLLLLLSMKPAWRRATAADASDHHFADWIPTCSLRHQLLRL